MHGTSVTFILVQVHLRSFFSALKLGERLIYKCGLHMSVYGTIQF